MRFILLLLSIVLIVFFNYDSWLNRYKRTERPAKHRSRQIKTVEKSSISNVFLLDTRALEYPIEKNNGALRIISNANLMEREFDAITPVEYTLSYRLFAPSGKELSSEKYHQYSKLSHYYKKKQLITPVFYINSPLVPTDSRIIVLTDPNIKKASRIKIELLSRSANIESVALRLYVNEKSNPEDARILWRRMSPKVKKELASGNIYPFTFLTEQEIKNLLSHLWKPVGPLGVFGKDYRMRTLYTYRDFKKEEPAERSVLPSGLFIGKKGHVTIPVIEAGVAKIQFTRLDRKKQGPLTIGVTWFGNQKEERWQKIYKMKDLTKELNIPADPGLLDISVSDDVALNATIKGNKSQKERKIDSYRLSMYQVESGKPVRYPLLPEGETILPLKVGLRYNLSKYPTQKVTAIYSFLEKNYRPVKSGSIILNDQKSSYDHLPGEKYSEKLSESTEVFFAVPSNVKYIQISSKTSIFVSCKNSPGTLKVTKVPEDYLRFRDRKNNIRSWFPLKPEGFNALLKGKRIQRIHTFKRPVDNKDDILAGDYEWEGFQPSEEWTGRYVLEPKKVQIRFREDVMGSIFYQIPTRAPFNIQIVNKSGMRTVSPEIIVQAEDLFPQKVTILEQGIPLWQKVIRGGAWQGKMIPLKGGNHNLETLAFSTTKIFMNHTMGQGPAFQRRLITKIDPKGLRFSIEKRDSSPYTLLLKYFSAKAVGKRSSLSVNIARKGRTDLMRPLTSWTFKRRLFSVQPGTTGRLRLLNTRNGTVDTGHLIFIPIKEDQPEGEYTVEIKDTDGEGGYLSLYRLVPGKYQKIELLHEAARGEITDE